MWQFLKENPFVVGAFSGSLAAYLLGLIVSHLRREKKWLGYAVASRNVANKNHSHLSILYEGREIKKLDSHTVAFRNVGNRPLTKIPVYLQSPEGGTIVEHEVNPPEGGNFKVNLQSSNILTLEIDLLNPGEVATVGLTISDSPTEEIKVLARAENLQLRKIDERINSEDLVEVLVSATFPPWGKFILKTWQLLVK